MTTQTRRVNLWTFSRTACAVAGVGIVLVLMWHGVELTETLRYAAYLFGAVVLPGTLVWRQLIRRHESANAQLPHLHSGLEDWVCGAAVGYALELTAYCAARAIGHPLLALAAPVLVVLTLWWSEAARWRRRGSVAASAEDRLCAAQGWAYAGLAGFVSLWWGMTMFSAHPLGSSLIVDPDEYFHLALIGELRHHFPGTYPYLEYDGGLTYQWFVHAHMAASTWVTGLPAELVYRRLDPLVLSLLGMLGASVVAVRVSRRLWAGPLAASILVLVGSFDVTGALPGEAAAEERFLQGPILMHSPTQALAYVLAVPVVLLCLELVRPGSRLPPTSWLGLLLGAVALTGAKVTVLPMLVCGLLLAAAVMFVRQRRIVGTHLLAALLIASVVALSGAVLYAGAVQPLTWEPLALTRYYMARLGVGGGGEVGQLVVTASLLVSWLVSAAGAVGLFRSAPLRWDARVWFLVGVAVSGLGASFLLGHGGGSQSYFGRSAAPALAVLSAWGLAELFPPGTSRRRVLSALVAAVAGGGLLLAVRAGTERWRTPHVQAGVVEDLPVLRIWVNLPAFLLLILVLTAAAVIVRDLSQGRLSLSLPVALSLVVGLGLARSFALVGGHFTSVAHPSPRYSYGSDGVAAAHYVREHSSPGERVATNAHCGPAQRLPDVCDNRHFWMSALTERRFVLEGWAYTGRTPATFEGGVFWDPSLLRTNDELFSRPSQEALTQFTSDHGVGWLLVDRRESVDESGLESLDGLSLRFADGDYAVFEVVASTGAQSKATD